MKSVLKIIFINYYVNNVVSTVERKGGEVIKQNQSLKTLQVIGGAWRKLQYKNKK